MTNRYIMHHALGLSEILYDIFGHFSPGDRPRTCETSLRTRTLAGLARTCRVFKEPALDVLWSELPGLLALARSVPDALYPKKRSHYAFKRPLTEAEWATIQIYARRVRIFHDCTLTDACLEEESVGALFSHRCSALFPSLRSLSWCYGRPSSPLYTATPSLRILLLDLRCGEVAECRKLLEHTGNLCPLIERFKLRLSRQSGELDNIVSNNVLCWPNLRILECGEVVLNMDAILHLSRVSKLTHLSFVLGEEGLIKDRYHNILLVFSYLERCEITSRSLLLAANLFDCTRLLAIKELTVKFPGSISKRTIQSFATALKNACSPDTLTHLRILSQHYLLCGFAACENVESNSDHAITYDDLYPCMTFSNLRSFKVNFEQPIHLEGNDLVCLGSAWPHIEDLSINEDAGWHSTGGLTLHGFVRLLRACPVLRDFCILFDTPTFQSIPEGMDVWYPPRQLGCVNLVESPLEAEVVLSGVVDVFAAIGFSPRFLMARRRIGTGRTSVDSTQAVFRSWRDVHDKVKARISDDHSEKNGPAVVPFT